MGPTYVLVIAAIFLPQCLVNAHQAATFPGTDNKQQIHHQGHAQQQQQRQHQQQPVAGHGQQPQRPSFNDPQHVREQSQHVKQHLENQINVEQTMTPEQLQFHYFKLHDYNNDNMLDGQELIKAITHVHNEPPRNDQQANLPPPPTFSQDDIENMVDSILRDDDFNSDGYIDYSEFLRAQTRNARAQEPKRG